MSDQQPIDSLAWIHVHERQLLCVRTDGKGKFYLPGGKRESGESDVAALHREVREELGVELDPMTFSLFAVLDEQADGFADGRRVRMTCYRAQHRGTLNAGAEIAELRWMSSEDADCCPPAGRTVLARLAKLGLVN